MSYSIPILPLFLGLQWGIVIVEPVAAVASGTAGTAGTPGTAGTAGTAGTPGTPGTAGTTCTMCGGGYVSMGKKQALLHPLLCFRQ